MKWKQADSTFKLLSKFGYIGIMHKFQELFETAVKMQSVSTSALAYEVIAAVKDGIAKNAMTEDESDELSKLKQSVASVDESFKKSAFIMLVASMMQMPGIMPADALAAELKNVPAA